MRAKIEELKQRHNPAQTELRMRHFFLQGAPRQKRGCQASGYADCALTGAEKW